MDDLPHDPHAKGATSPDPAATPDRPAAPRAPRWVMLFGIIALVLVVLLAVATLTGGGGHGPDRHAPPSDAGGAARVSGAASSPVPLPAAAH